MAAPIGNTYALNCETSGRPKLLSPESMLSYFARYAKYVKDNPVEVQDFVGKDATEVFRKKEQPLTLEGFEDFVAENGGPYTMVNYFANSGGRYEEFSSVCFFIRRKIRADQIKGGMVGIYNPSITQRLNGLTEKTETVVKNSAPEIDLTALPPEILEKLIEAKLISNTGENQY